MKTLSPKEELLVIKDMIQEYQKKRILSKDPEDKQQYSDIIKVLYDMKEIRDTQVEILETFDKQKVA